MENYKALNDIEMLSRMDELHEELSIEIQKAISLTMLNVNAEEAFKDALILLESVFSIYGRIEEEFSRMIAFVKVKEAVDLMESKIPQINK